MGNGWIMDPLHFQAWGSEPQDPLRVCTYESFITLWPTQLLPRLCSAVCGTHRAHPQVARSRRYQMDRRGILSHQVTFQLSHKLPKMAQYVAQQGSQDGKQGFYQRNCGANTTMGSITQAALASGSLLGKTTRNYGSTGKLCHFVTQNTMRRCL